MARLIQFARQAVYVGLDYSTGGWGDIGGLGPPSSADPDDPVIYAERIHWLQGSLGIELRSLKSGFVFRPYLGVAAMLNPGDRRCVLERSGGDCFLSQDDFSSSEIFVIGAAIGLAE